MKRERKEVWGVLSLGTLLKVSAVSGLAIGLMCGVFAGVVSFMARGSLFNLLLFVVVTPPVTAVLLVLITIMGHPLYAALSRAGLPGLDKVVYEVSKTN
ncbi:MAG: hypothetical protein GTO41_16980 [Burkholderiales bacterium]|nr:hypothetical protein [Burkholderiales bacterium]